MSADDLKKLAEAYPRIAAIQAEVDLGETLLTLTPEIHELLDLAAQLYAENRALNERIEMAAAIIRNCRGRMDRAGLSTTDADNWLSGGDAAQTK